MALSTSISKTREEGMANANREQMKNSAWICVLNDNDTWTGLDGSWIAITEEGQQEALYNDERVCDLDLTKYSLRTLIDWAIDAGYFDEQTQARLQA
jgi:hypothetical protein